MNTEVIKNLGANPVSIADSTRTKGRIMNINPHMINKGIPPESLRNIITNLYSRCSLQKVFKNYANIHYHYRIQNFNMPDPAVYTPPNTDVETKELILHIRKRKWKYLFIILFFGGISFYFFKFKMLVYSSTASFFVNEKNVISSASLDLKSLENISPGDNFNRIYELVNSASTQKHLIEKFDLLGHYGIDSNNEFSSQKAISKLRSCIIVKKNPFNTISVTVSDRYRYLTADMANEIILFLEQLNREYFLENIKQKVLLSQAFVVQLQNDNAIKIRSIDSLIHDINRMLSLGKGDTRSMFELISHQQMLSQLISNFQTSSNELLNSQRLYNLSLQAMNFNSFPTITVLQQAMPAARSTLLMALIYSMLVMILVSLVIILQAYLIMHYRDFIRLVVKGE